MPKGFHLIKGNRKDSPKVEAVPIWLRRRAQGSFAALLQLTARKEEHWEMRSLRVIKALRFALLPGQGWLLSSGQRIPCSGYGLGSRGRGAGSAAGTPLPRGTALPGAEHAGTLWSVPFPHPPTHSACVGACPSPSQGLGSPPLRRTCNACSRCRGGHVQAVLTPQS